MSTNSEQQVESSIANVQSTSQGNSEDNSKSISPKKQVNKSNLTPPCVLRNSTIYCSNAPPPPTINFERN